MKRKRRFIKRAVLYPVKCAKRAAVAAMYLQFWTFVAIVIYIYILLGIVSRPANNDD